MANLDLSEGYIKLHVAEIADEITIALRNALLDANLERIGDRRVVCWHTTLMHKYNTCVYSRFIVTYTKLRENKCVHPWNPYGTFIGVNIGVIWSFCTLRTWCNRRVGILIKFCNVSFNDIVAQDSSIAMSRPYFTRFFLVFQNLELNEIESTFYHPELVFLYSFKNFEYDAICVWIYICVWCYHYQGSSTPSDCLYTWRNAVGLPLQLIDARPFWFCFIHWCK